MWNDQYQRARRSIERVKAHYSGKSGFSHFGTAQVAEFRDDVLHAFQDLFHIRDWLLNDPNVNVSSDSIKRLFKNDPEHYPALHLVRDLAVGSKHLENTLPSVNADAALAKTSHVAWKPSGQMEDSVIGQSVNIELGVGNVHDALMALDEGLSELDAFLVETGLHCE